MLKNKLFIKINLLSFLLLMNSSLANAQDNLAPDEVKHDVSSLPSLLGIEQPAEDNNMSADQLNNMKSRTASNLTKRIIYIKIIKTKRTKSAKFQAWRGNAWKTADTCGSESPAYASLTHYVYKKGSRVSLYVPAGYRYDGYRLRKGFDVYGTINHDTYTVDHNFRYSNERGRRADVYIESHYRFYDGYSCYIAYQGFARH